MILTRARLIRRLQWYYPTELFNAWAITACFGYVAWRYPLAAGWPLLFGLGLMAALLFQGQFYWHVKLRVLLGEAVEAAATLRRFAAWRRANGWGLALVTVALLGQAWLTATHAPGGELWPWMLLATTFGVLEHINYYHWQLMLDTVADWRYVGRYRRLKIASLRKDLREGRL